MRIRPNWLLLGVGALLVAALFLYPQWRTLLNRRNASTGGLYSAVSSEQRAVLIGMQRTPNANPDQAYQALLITVVAPTSDAPTPDGTTMQLIKEGDFTTIDAVHTATGHAALYRKADNSALLRLDNFTVSNGPNLEVYLSAAANPQTVDDFKTNKLQFAVGALKGTTGAQNYDTIPPDLDLTRYKSVVIFSDSLQAIYSSAALN